jgi:hypothetical protein
MSEAGGTREASCSCGQLRATVRGGATVFYQNDRHPDVYAIPVGAFADPGFPAPERSVWEERRHAWVTMPDGIEHID